MNETERMEWLRRFSETCGVSGFEGRMKQLMQERLAAYKDVSYDKLGSVIFTKRLKMLTHRKSCWPATWMKSVSW